jgi:hypothetical protein
MKLSQRSLAGLVASAAVLALATGGVVAATAVHHVSAAGHATITILRPTSTSLTSGMAFGRLRTNGANASGGTVTIFSSPPSAFSFSGVERAGGGRDPSPAVYSIKGEKSRAYTVSFPAPSVESSPGGYRVSNFTLWSANSGAITSGGTGHMNAMGTDTLRVGATMTVPAGVRPTDFSAVVPITILAQ